MSYEYPEVSIEGSMVLMVKYFSSLVLWLSFNTFSLPHLLPFSCFQGRGESCPTAPLHPQRAFVHPALTGPASPIPSGIPRAGAQRGWARRTQLSLLRTRTAPGIQLILAPCINYIYSARAHLHSLQKILWITVLVS